MDVKEVGSQIPATIPVDNKAGAKKATGGEFQRVLDMVSPQDRNTDRASINNRADAAEELFSICPSSPHLDFKPDEVKGFTQHLRLIDVTERLFGLLEEYQNALGDRNTTLKQLEPIVRSIAKETVDLKSLTEKIPQTDPLHTIAEELAVLSTVEIEKFNRGDYL